MIILTFFSLSHTQKTLSGLFSTHVELDIPVTPLDFLLSGGPEIEIELPPRLSYTTVYCICNV